MADKKTILVTGATGQLGSELRELAGNLPGFNFIFTTRAEIPLDDLEAIKTFTGTISPDYIINAAAYTAVDKAETSAAEAAAARKTNAEAPALLAAICRERNIGFIHVSTDYVFDGKASRPYRENDPANPPSVYGTTKREGEVSVQENCPAAIIIRTSWVYSSFGKNFVKTMLRLMNERKEIGVVNDQLGSPTYAADLAQAILHILSSGKWEPGIYHYSNEGIISWFDFAAAIAEEINTSCTVKPIRTEEYPVPAPRPAYSVLDTGKIKSVYRITIPHGRESLRLCLEKIKNTPAAG